MKLIIDVSEELVCKGFEQHFTEEERQILIMAIGNGKPYEERPHGEWNYIQAGMCVCPFCGAYPHKDYKNFCPNCGADMREAGND